MDSRNFIGRGETLVSKKNLLIVGVVAVVGFIAWKKFRG
jgi:hypothetical protein